MASHHPVLLAEAIAALCIHPEGVYVDGTFGRGGHSQAILDQLGPNGQLWVIDKDPQAMEAAHALKQQDARVQVYHGSFAELLVLAEQQGLVGKINGILLDLGVSSPQLDQAERGFSFHQDGPLDMRMNPDAGESVAQWLVHAEFGELARILKQYGEERQAKRVARAILAAQAKQPLVTTKQLADVVQEVLPYDPHKHPATRTFQALRIFINQELADLEQALLAAHSVLASEGGLAVISFHSLEDRIVKQTMTSWVKPDDLPPGLPLTQAEVDQRSTFTWQVKRCKPNAPELAENNRARSATLRAVKKR